MKQRIATWQQIPSAAVTELLATFSQCVVLDTEHAAFNNETISSCIQVARQKTCECYVRLTHFDDSRLIRYCLDSGATGLIFSTIEKLDQLKVIKQHCFYPTNTKAVVPGRRGMGLCRCNLWGETTLPLHTHAPAIVLQIETAAAIQNLHNLVPAAQGVFSAPVTFMIGPYDLSMSLGMASVDTTDSRFVQAMASFNKHVPAEQRGIHLVKDISAQQLKDVQQYGFVAVGMDTLALIRYCKNMYTKIAEAYNAS